MQPLNRHSHAQSAALLLSDPARLITRAYPKVMPAISDATQYPPVALMRFTHSLRQKKRLSCKARAIPGHAFRLPECRGTGIDEALPRSGYRYVLLQGLKPSAMDRVHGADLHHERLRAQMPPPTYSQTTNKVLMIVGHTYSQHAALYPDRPYPPMMSNQGILHFCLLNKVRHSFSQHRVPW